MMNLAKIREITLQQAAQLAGKAGHYCCRIAEFSPVFADYLLQPVAMFVIKKADKAYQLKGEQGWALFYQPAFSALGKARSAYLQKKMQMQKGDAASLGRYHDYEDPLLGVEGHWEKQTKTEAIRIETACPYGDYLKTTGNHHLCEKLIGCMERSTATLVDPQYELLPLEELISKGDERCVFIHRTRQTD